MPNPGDKVRIITDEEKVEGILMPRPDILDKDITVVKLDNGYNIGIDNKRIKKVELLEGYTKKKDKRARIKFNKSLPTVAILSTGGTISSKVDYRTGGTHANYTAEDFVDMYPELKDTANIKARKIMSVMTEDMTSKEWIAIAKEAEKELNGDANGVVITMGTDMLHFASAALSFLLKGLNKPVIITAAQRSIDRGSSDAFMNLGCAVTAAAKFNAAEVVSCMHGTTNDDYCLLIRGTKIRKMHTSRRDAFRPVNEPPLAKVFSNGKIEITNNDYKKKSDLKVKADKEFEEKVALVQVYPGMEPEIIDFYINKGYKGIVVAATALGHVPTSDPKYSLIPKLKKAIDKGVPVVIASQTLYGRVHPYVYTNLRKLSIELKCIFAEDMLPEVAYIKLGWVLASTKELAKVKEMMLTNYHGEINKRILPESFLY
ncbi:Glu-tRNA(Gln) amidotransferase GatDE subunit D [Candidatus Woesearchaeota archaeon]|nr:Glu-tRNA(Gln) amidotransferase GatDE subunit D [Candidatus Woesearchaeota archaeon]|tara:strand:- start:7844 stop:9133 length:1290 start_codon:yes stop_codon:yes gene_type:complete